jgi:hypothetical protein
MPAIADDVNLLGDNRYHKGKKNRNFKWAGKVGLEVNPEKTQYMLLSHHQNKKSKQFL